MCQPISKGGQRCASHTRDRLIAASTAAQEAAASQDLHRIAQAQQEWDDAAAEYASTPAGKADLTAKAQDAAAEGDDRTAQMFQAALRRGETMREANQQTAALLRASTMVTRHTPANPASYTDVFGRTVMPGGEDAETLVRGFGCENHDAPGSCTSECALLLDAMDSGGYDDGPVYDPEGVHGGPPRSYDTHEFDEQARATFIVTHVPEGHTLASIVQPGQWVWVDHEARRVDAVHKGGYHRVMVEFVGYDKEPDGTPSGYFTRTFSADKMFPLASEESARRFARRSS